MAHTDVSASRSNAATSSKGSRSDARRHEPIEAPRGQRSWRDEIVDRPGSFLPNYDPDDEERLGGRAYGYGAGGRGTETFGMAMTEALARGIPVVVRNTFRPDAPGVHSRPSRETIALLPPCE